MLQIKRILFPTDFSRCAEHAFAQATYLAEEFGAELHVLHAIVHHRQNPGDVVMDFPFTEDEVAEQLHLARGSQSDDKSWAHGVPIIQARVLDVSAAVAVLDYADKHDIDLIVMGTHGRRGMDRLFLGSVAEEVVRFATCPVYTVRENPAPLGGGGVSTVLVPVDFSNCARVTLQNAAELAVAYGASLTVLHVIEEAVLPHVYGIEPLTLSSADLEEKTTAALQELVEDTVGSRVPFEIVVAIGHPAPTIVDAAREHAADMVVISTHGRTGVPRLVMGSVAEKVVRMAPCPVFTVKTFGKSLVVEEKTAPIASAKTKIKPSPSTAARA